MTSSLLCQPRVRREEYAYAGRVSDGSSNGARCTHSRPVLSNGYAARHLTPEGVSTQPRHRQQLVAILISTLHITCPFVCEPLF